MSEQVVPAQMTDVSLIKTYLLAGKSTFTIQSEASQKRFTFHLKGKDDGAIFFVSVMTGTSNDHHDFETIGFIKRNKFFYSKKSTLPKDHPSIGAFEWFFDNLRVGRLSEKVKFYHSGRCGRCLRKLTVPSSVMTGLGPECASREGFRAEPMGKAA